MRPRTRPLAWVLLGLDVALVLVSVVVSWRRESAFDTATYGLNAAALGGAGTLVVRLHPRNPIGWLLSGLGVSAAFVEVAEGYGYHSWPHAHLATWLSSPGYLVSVGFYAPVFLLFPSGRLTDRRLRWVLWSAVAASAVAVVGTGFSHLDDVVFAPGDNPYARGPVFEVIGIVGQVAALACLVLSIVVLVVRVRRSSGVERQQLRVVLAPIALLAVAGPLAGVLYFDSPVVQVLIGLVVTAIPLALCVAILRFRLYDADLAINRGLSYAALTVALAAAYVGTTLLVGTAVGRRSPWAVAGGTLAAAAVFQLLRRRVQDRVDRHFNRARYDALAGVDRFLEDLRADRAEVEDVEPVLRRCLADPGLLLRFFLPGDVHPVDLRGDRVAVAPGRDTTGVLRAGVRLAEVVHRPEVGEGRRTLDQVLERAALPIELARLRIELRRQLVEVEESRTRLLEAGYAERRRLERDLHDGAQQRLVSIGLVLRHAQHELGAGAVSSQLDGAVVELGAAINELRALAHGVRPAELQVGLGSALRGLAGRSPVPVEVSAGPERYPEDIEAAAYFVASEAVANVVKHARASRVVMHAAASDGRLVLRVSDDGIGGARLADGAGLRGLADRVAAHGGRLLLVSEAGHGTTLTAELPCAS